MPQEPDLDAEPETMRLVAAVDETREKEWAARERAHLAYCQAILALVKHEESVRGTRGAQARAGRLLDMSAQNVGVMIGKVKQPD